MNAWNRIETRHPTRVFGCRNIGITVFRQSPDLPPIYPHDPLWNSTLAVAGGGGKEKNSRHSFAVVDHSVVVGV